MSKPNVLQLCFRFLARAAALSAAALCASASVVACDDGSAPAGPPIKADEATATAKPATPPKFGRLERKEFNRLAAQLHVPLFWERDEGDDGVVTPKELVPLWGYGSSKPQDLIAGGKFGPAFAKTYEQLVAAKKGAPAAKQLAPAEAKRRAAVRKELAQGQPMVVRSSFRDASKQDRAIVGHILAAAEIIEKLFAKQRGFEYLTDFPPKDAPSRMLMLRNQGPWCQAPKTESDPDCNALPSKPKNISGLYPAKLQEDEKFCDALAKRPDGEKLLHQFVVVREQNGALKPVPYTEVYKSEMEAIAKELKAAAAAIESDDEEAFKTYLLAAAQAFLDNDWERADEAWAKMNAENSKFYLRIGPDEVYFEPCNRKAGFHVSFARINQDSLAWQKKLDPVKNDLEKALATLAGQPYEARKVSFHLPDFVDIILNAGDSRSPMGATIGQSLPNWGPVANEGRGRTVAMTNLYTDADSQAVLKSQAASLLCRGSHAKLTTDPKPMTMSTVLHEAAHNLGPAHEYEVDGKKAPKIFGGPLASTLEELKAQTAALYLADWLAGKDVIDRKLADRSHVRDLVWAFGHISRGMYTATKKPRPYSQLAAIQLAYLRDRGAITWDPKVKAANGKDLGCIELRLEKFPKATEELMRLVGGIKARGDLDGANKLIADYVDVEGDKKALLDTISKRWQRAPKATFVYAIEL